MVRADKEEKEMIMDKEFFSECVCGTDGIKISMLKYVDDRTYYYIGFWADKFYAYQNKPNTLWAKIKRTWEFLVQGQHRFEVIELTEAEMDKMLDFMLEIRGRKEGKKWYSICSKHQTKDDNCEICANGEWK